VGLQGGTQTFTRAEGGGGAVIVSRNVREGDEWGEGGRI
jgi:hypothetical protein